MKNIWKIALLRMVLGVVSCSRVDEHGNDPYDGKRFLFINGEEFDIASDSRIPAHVNSIFVYEGKIYIAGTKREGLGTVVLTTATVSILQPKINGSHEKAQESILMETTENSFGESVFVSDGDVYVAGYERIKRPNYVGQYYYRAVLWKNGKLQSIECEHGTGIIYSIYVSGNDVYALGLDANDKALWKNGVKHIVYHDATRLLSTLFVYDGDIYAGGTDGFWINKEKQSYGTYGVNTIFVK